MVVILLSLFHNHDNLILNLHQKKKFATLMKDVFLLANSKLEVYQEWKIKKS